MAGGEGFQCVDGRRKQAECKSIPVVVVTAKDLTAEDRERLSGRVGLILQKGAYSSEDLLRETSALVMNRIRKRTPADPRRDRQEALVAPIAIAP